MPFGFKDVFCKNAPKEFASDFTLINPAGVVKRSATVFPVAFNNKEGCCLRKANTQTKHITQVNTPNLKYVLLFFMSLKIKIVCF